MIDLLRASAHGPPAPAKVEAVLAAHGTQFIVRQQNISRAVTSDQYRTLLLNLDRERMPTILPADPGGRARRGVEGLHNDVWPALHWGVTHTDLLAKRVAALKELDVFATAEVIATKFLPEAVPLTPRLHVVMGGREPRR